MVVTFLFELLSILLYRH